MKIKKSVLILGNLLIATGTLHIYNSPISGYNPQIYSSPVFYLIAISSMVLIFTYLLTRKASSELRIALSTSIMTSVIVIVSYPIISGAYFISEGDALTHFGTIQDILNGVVNPSEIFYPGTHILTVIITEVGAGEPRISTMILPIIFVLLYIISIPLIFRDIVGNFHGEKVGLVSGLCLLPVSQHGIHFSPTFMAILYSSFVLFSFIKYGKNRKINQLVVFLCGFFGILILHPQQAINLILLLAGIAVIAGLANGISLYNFAIASNLTVLLGMLAYLWISDKSTFAYSFVGLLTSFISSTVDSTGETSDGDTLNQVLQSIDASIFEIFLKLFLNNLVFILLAVLVSMCFYKSYSDRNIKPMKNPKHLTPILIVSLIPIVILFVGLFVTGSQYFRYFYFAMVPTTIGGGYALYRASVHQWGTIRKIGHYVLMVLIVISLVSIHPSPYVYQPTNQITQQQFVGYEWSADYGNTNHEFIRIRSPVDRYLQATNKVNTKNYSEYIGGRNRPRKAPSKFSKTGLSSSYDSKKYLPVTSVDTYRESQLWNGYRYSSHEFRYLEEYPDTVKIYESGGNKIYLLRNYG